LPPVRWLAVRLQGTASPASALGARLALTVTGRDGERTIYRWVTTGGSFGVSPHEQLFPLGPDPAAAVRLKIRWPAGGGEQVVDDLPVDARITIREGEPGFAVERFRAADLAAAAGPGR
jgi:hypothetical protein